MATGYLLTEKDRELIRGLIAEERRRYGGTAQRPHNDGEDWQTPEVYVANTPEGGIPALSDLGTGSGAGPGDVPGYADCDIYKIKLDGDGEPTTVKAGSLSKRVYNFSASGITGDSWVLTIRDKFGKWIAVVGGGSGGNAAFLEITDDEKDADGYQDAKFIDGGPEDDPVKIYNRSTTTPALPIGKVVYAVKKTGGPETPEEIDVPVYAIHYEECP